MLLSGRLLGIFRLFHGFRDGASSLGLGVPGVFFFWCSSGLKVWLSRFGDRFQDFGGASVVQAFISLGHRRSGFRL